MQPTQITKRHRLHHAWLSCAMIVGAIHVFAAELPETSRIDPALQLGHAAATEDAPPAAAAASLARPLTVESCVRIALDRNPMVRAAHEGVAAAREVIGVATATYYPEVGLFAGYRRFDTHLFFPSELSLGDTSLGATDDWSAGLFAGYTLYDSGWRKAERETAVAGSAAVGYDAARVRQDVVLSVHEAYYRVLSALALQTASVTSLERSRDHVELAQTRKAAGAAPRSDVLRAEVEAAAAELAVVRANGAVRQARGDLNTAMGLPVDLPVELEPTQQPIEPLADIDIRNALDRALERRPEVAAAGKRIAAAGKHVEAIKAFYGPRVRAEGAFGWRDSDFLPEDQNWSIGVSFQLPVFTGFARTHRVAEAASETRIVEAEAEALADRVQLEVWQAASRRVEAHQAVHQSEVLRATAAESLQFAVARYEAGASTITDLLDAESALSQADSAHIAAVFGYHLAESRLVWAQGDL